jgi:hypothetical protein
MQTPKKTQKPTKPQAQAQTSPLQDLYDIFVAQGIRIAFKIAPQLQGKSSIDVLGNALFNIVNKIETEGAKNGIKFPLEVLLHGSNEILGHLIEATKVKINEQQIKAVVSMAVGKWIENAMKTGKMTKDQLIQLAQQAQQAMPQPQQAQQPSPAPQQGASAPAQTPGAMNPGGI